MTILHREKKHGCEIILFKEPTSFVITLEIKGRPFVMQRTVDTIQEACRIVKVFRDIAKGKNDPNIKNMLDETFSNGKCCQCENCNK
jgi:hypothetical protein